ncbi:MAG TPA: ferric reductase-like transmembrane domain-containing protein [Gemmatimonadales bacterium]|jgi:sulfoxide reductase heme-binding subunit YedZ
MIALSAEGRLRVRRHTALALGSVAATLVLTAGLPGDLRGRVSTATAYVALALLAVTLSLGPLNVLRGRPNPVSFNLRRDFGIWSAIVGLCHSAIGLTVHFRGRMHLYFFAQPGQRTLAGLRADAFGAANDTGLIAAVLLLVLALISNDIALRGLGTSRWRTVQRSAYVVLGLAMLHAGLYQLIEKPRWWRVLIFVLASAVALTLQARGVRRHHRLTRVESGDRAPGRHR